MIARYRLKHPINHADMEMHMGVQAGAETVDKGHSANTHGRLVNPHRAGAVFMKALLHDPQENAQRGIECRAITLHEIP